MLPDLVDPNIIVMATSWLNGQVDDRGSVLEPGRVIHTEMQVSLSVSCLPHRDRVGGSVAASPMKVCH